VTNEQARGRVAVMVEAADPASARSAADLVADRLRADGGAVFRASARDFVRGAEVDRPFLRSALVESFLAGESFPLVGSRSDGGILFDPLWTSAPADACLVIDCAVEATSVVDH
jgi:hypothetical protein